MFKISTSDHLTVSQCHSLSYVMVRKGEIRYDSVGHCWDTGTEGYTLIIAFLLTVSLKVTEGLASVTIHSLKVYRIELLIQVTTLFLKYGIPTDRPAFIWVTILNRGGNFGAGTLYSLFLC